MKYRKKQLEATDDLLEAIEAATRTTVSADDIAIFEAAAASTKPVNKPGSLYHESVFSRSVLEEMVQRLNAGEVSVPLHTMHLQGEELPVGRVFKARIQDEIDGSTTLIATFFIGRTHKDLIESINLGVLDEVSVGVMPSSLQCSKCSWDYTSEEADFTHLLSQTCENGHTVGVDGVHLKFSGLADWMELSLVSRGAAKNPKILSRAKSLVPAEDYDRMAASGRPAEAVMLFANHKMEIPRMEDDIPETTPADFDFAGAFQSLTVALEGITENLTALNAAVTAPKTDENPEADPALEADGGEEDDIEELKAQLAATQAKVAELEAAAAAAQESAETETAPAEPQAKPEFTPGGLAASAVSDAEKTTPKVVSSAFKSKR